MSQEKRRMPVEKEWFDKNLDKLLYCLMQSFSLEDKKQADAQKRVYYPKAQFIRDTKLIKKSLGIKDKRTLNSKLNTLFEKGYLAEDEDNYYFPFIVGKDHLYYLIDKELLKALTSSSNGIGIGIFIYLAFAANAKKGYQFTITELMKVLGYQTGTDKAGGSAFQIVAGALAGLKESKFLDYGYKKVTLDDGHIITNMYITNIATKVPEERKAEVKKATEAKNENSEKLFEKIFNF